MRTHDAMPTERSAFSPAALLARAALSLLHALVLMCGATARIFGRRPPRTFVGAPPSVPEHLGIVLAADEGAAATVAALARLVGWCAAAGVRRITVCDMHGVVQPSTAALRGALGGAAVVVAGGPFSPVDAGAQVRVVPAQAGREELVATARRLCRDVCDARLAVDAVDEAAVERTLAEAGDGGGGGDGAPEPELVLQFCQPMILGGLLPWHCRYTQFAPMGRLRDATRPALLQTLADHSRVTQRHGK